MMSLHSVSSKSLQFTTKMLIVRPTICASRETFSTSQVQQSKKKREPKPPRKTDSFALGLFQGVTNLKEVFPFPDVLTNEEKDTTRELMEPLERFLSEVNDASANDTNEKIPDDVVDQMKEMGILGAMVSPDYGGLGLRNTQYARMTEVIGANDLGVGIFAGAHQSIGYKGIYLFGTEEQKKKYLPDLTCGKKLAAFCLTEPSSGSDAGSIKTRAVKSEDGSHYILNGGKIWISNGGIAEIFTVFAQVPVKDPETGESRDKVTAFIVERSFGGVTSGPPEKKMGIKCSNTAEVNFDNVKIPVANLLGEEGGGFKVAMNILNNGRFGLAASMAGTIKGVLKQATEWASNRTQFGQKISEFGVIQEKLCRMAMDHYVTESMAYMIANNMDKGVTEFQIEAAIAKVFCSEAAWKATDECIQVLGGMGYMKESGVERVMRDLRIFRIFEGTNDILRLFIALTGIQHAAAHLGSIQKAFQNPLQNMTTIFGVATRKLMNQGVLPRSPDAVSPAVHPELADSGKQLASCIVNFSSTVEHLIMKYKKDVVNQQFQLTRLGDAAIDIYGMAVVLSRCSDSLSSNLPSAQFEQRATRLFCAEASERAAGNLHQIKSKSHQENFKDIASICKDVLKSGGVVQKPPIGF